MTMSGQEFQTKIFQLPGTIIVLSANTLIKLEKKKIHKLSSNQSYHLFVLFQKVLMISIVKRHQLIME